MIDTSDTIDGAAACAMCGGPLDGGRYVSLAGWSSLYIFCSGTCVGSAARSIRKRRWAVRRTRFEALLIGATLVAGCLTRHQGPARAHHLAHAMPVKVAEVGPPALPPGWFGPEWPPTDRNLLAALGEDAWIHPLSGPVRRMPRSDSRVFGAVRPGDRAPECRNGHCGVDLGGEIWGEQVHAVHDGVVDWVKRGINPDHGGQFVRIAHHNGTVFTQYFHLAAIRRDLERGVPVKGGEVIGLLGDTGVQHSEPHLHFAITVRPAKDWPERYIDPEPLIALWPLRVPVEGTEVGLVTTVGEPGLPLGSMPLRPGKRKLAAQKRAGKKDRDKDRDKDRTAKAAGEDEAPAAPETDESPDNATDNATED